MAETMRRCRTCGVELVPVVYGYPSPDVVERAGAGRVVLGGCDVTAGEPHRACPACGLPF